MSGADWDAILSGDATLDLEGLDVEAVTERLGQLDVLERESLVAALDAEKAKVVKRGDVIDTALDVFKSVLGAVT